MAPAAHYSCGGITAELDGTTSLPGLFAVGEVTSTGVHGANRLASNSLTESIVAGTRVGRDLAWELPERARVEPDLDDAETFAAVRSGAAPRGACRDVTPRRRDAQRVGPRDGHRRARHAEPVDESNIEASRESWEATNLLTVASGVVSAALARTESRGCHRRADHPDTDPSWVRHLDVVLDAVGAVDVRPEP